MPPLSRRYLATAATLVMLGMLVGFWMLVRRDLGIAGPTRGEISAHAHLILVGGVIQLIIGVAWWLFPRPQREPPRAALQLANAAWWLLTVGTLLRAGGEVAIRPAASLIGGTAQMLGLAAAVASLRHRVIPSRNPAAR